MMGLDRIRDYYAENPLMVSSPFGGVNGLNVDLFHSVLARLNIDVAGKDVLDIGCGRAFAADYVGVSGGRYVGIDCVASRKGIPLAMADAAALPFGPGQYDALFCVDAFEHFPAPVQCAREMRRVLRRDGFLFLSVPNYANVAGLVKLWCEHVGAYEKNSWAPFGHWQAQEHETMLTPGRVRRIFSEAGFTRFRRIAHADDVLPGLLPWAMHRRCPEFLLYRLQGLFRRIGPALATACPTLSLHNFWKIGP